MRKIVTVGASLDDAGKNVLDVIGRIERGEQVEATDRVNFASWSALASVMTDKRLELLQHLRGQPAANIRQLAATIGRDYKRVHEDVTRLEEAGLIDRDDDGSLCVRWAEIQALVKLGEAA